MFFTVESLTIQRRSVVNRLVDLSLLKFHPGENSIKNHEIPYAGEWVGLRFPRKNQVIAALTVHG
jgi:hypothetical protein